MPLLKKPPANVVANYCPIRLTSSVCKVMKIIVKEAPLACFSSSSLFHSVRHGFRPGFSTLTELILPFRDWSEAFNDKVQNDVV